MEKPKCPSTEECIMKMRYINKMEYYLAVKKKDMIFTYKWIDLKNILIKVTQSKIDIPGI